jgi:beta-1,4-mannosyl-glycoprotein beta-1,4-N-acetylglucosaminyltransferase
MKVFDCFTFFNELDLLKIRLEFLKDTVDYHVIVESNLTFSGNQKPYYIEDNWQEFKNWKNKIVYIKLEQSKDSLEFKKVNTYSPDNGSWLLEYQQRNGIHYAVDMPRDSDMVLVGDLDEIPDPNAILRLKEVGISEPSALTMLFHYYYMNCQNVGYERYWNGTVVCDGSYFKQTLPQTIRDNRNSYRRLANAGYHFSFLGGAEKIKTKIESFAHTEFDREDIKSEDNIRECLEKGKDIFNRPGVQYKFVSVEDYPENIRSIMLKYPQFIKQ